MMSVEVGEYIPGYEGKYSVTKDGHVYSHLSERFLNPSPDNKGYLRVTLYSDGIQKTIKVHRLVAKLFIPNPHCKPEVNHINGDKTDNTSENLEWSTSSENSHHAYRTGLKRGNNGVINGRAKLSEADVIAIRNSSGMKLRELSAKYGVTEAQISTVRRGNAWRHL
ncbi:HNH endonuclease [Cronobacter sakazakii]|nr:HNH endonuclease [Cronobacter sakazakii]